MHIAIGFILLMGLLSGFEYRDNPRLREKESPEGEIVLFIGPGDQVEVRQIVKPQSEIQDERVIKQAYDYSCGSAALATILNYYLGEGLSERQVIQGMLRYGHTKKISERRAFSLLDMKKFVNVLGYRGVGYKAEIKDLKTLGMPCLLPLNLFRYRHFVIFKGIYGGRVFLADPYSGNVSYTLPEFRDMWHQNIIFVVYPDGARELTALRLRDEDLRFIDEDTAQQILFDHAPDVTPPEARRMGLVPKPHQYYKP